MGSTTTGNDICFDPTAVVDRRSLDSDRRRRRDTGSPTAPHLPWRLPRSLNAVTHLKSARMQLLRALL